MSHDQTASDEAAQRRAALERLRARGIEPFPANSQRDHTCAEAAALADTPTAVIVAGRAGSVREMGKIAFTHLTDETGRVQLVLRRDVLGEDGWALLHDIHAGDVLEASGDTLRTRHGEASVGVQRMRMLAKALLPPAEKHHGLKDVELRTRYRYLDLLANAESRDTFRMRSAIITGMRRFLDQRGYLEVETPVLQPLYGGAFARPFTTFHNELEQTLYLRISDELYLKRLIVGGFDKVYEIAHDFRNEGVSHKHNTEFTMLELYAAYQDYHDVMALTEELVATLAQEVLGTTKITFQGHSVDVTPPWRRLTMRQALLDAIDLDFTLYPTAAALAGECQERRLAHGPVLNWAKMIDELVKEHVEPGLIQPTFLMDYPWELSPLAKRHRDSALLVERFEGYVAGFEFCNAFSELNDPDDQRARFGAQQQAAAEGDDEAQQLDEPYIEALAHGMPPTGGLGIGVDRLAMLFADRHSIRDVILFPHMRDQ